MLAYLFRHDVIKRLSHGYCPIGPKGNAMRAVPSLPMGHFQWDSHGNSISIDKPGYSSVVCTLLAISFLEYWNNRTGLPISGSFAKLPRNLKHLCLQENSFFNQRFQHFGSDFIFTSSFSIFFLLIAVATSVAMKTSSSPICTTSCVSQTQVDVFTGFQKIFKAFPPSRKDSIFIR